MSYQLLFEYSIFLLKIALLNNGFLLVSVPCSVFVLALTFALFGIGFDTESTEHILELVRG
jgi:uncharacterized membrane protein